MLRYKADYKTLAYMAVTTSLLIIQWQLETINIALYVICLFFAVSVAVIAHNHNHLAIWKKKHKLLNILTDYWLTLFYGFPVFGWIPTHNKNHHKLNNREGDYTITYRYSEKNNLLTLLPYPSISGYFQQKAINIYLKELKIKNKQKYWLCMSQYLVLVLFIGIALVIDWQKALIYIIIPQQFSLYSVMIFNYVQHVHTDEESPVNHSIKMTLAQQDTLSTYPTLLHTKGGHGISFELTVNQHFLLHNLEFALNVDDINWKCDIYLREGGVSTVGVPPVIDAANGWILIGQSSVTNVLSGVPYPMNDELDTLLSPGTYGIYISSTTGAFGLGVMNWSSTHATTFTDGIATIKTDTNTSYSGLASAVSPTPVDQFLGSVIYTPFTPVQDDATVSSLNAPVFECPGVQQVATTIRNWGSNKINNVQVNWSIDGAIQTPVTHNQPLDTIGGTDSYQAQIALGTMTVQNNQQQEVKIWTSLPNGNVDPNAANDTLTAEVEVAMNGDYTIDSSGTGIRNFLSIQDAVETLKRKGVCGPVAFNIQSGVYWGQVIIETIPGASVGNTVIFQSDPANTSPVEMKYVAVGDPDNFVVKLKGCRYITIDGLTISNEGVSNTTIIQYDQNAQYNVISNCKLIAPLTTGISRDYSLINSYSKGNNAYNTIRDNYLYGGSYSIVFRGSSAEKIEGISIVGNELVDPYYYGMYIYYCDKLNVSDNSVFSNSGRTSTSSYGIRVFDSDDGVHVVGNKVGGPNIWPVYGLRVDNSDNSATNRGLIANNLVHAGAINIASSSLVGIDSDKSTYLDIVHNTVAVEGSSTRSHAADLTRGQNNRVFNNNFLHYGNGYAVYVDSGSFTMDYNNLATAGSVLCYYRNSVGNVADLATWQLLGQGEHSINVDSIYSNLDSLRTCDARIDGKGAWLVYASEDIDGELRNTTTPDIGADEFTAMPDPIFIGDTLEFCAGEALELKELSGNVNFGTYAWSTSENTPSIVVTTPGTYSLSITACGTSMDEVEVVDISPTIGFEINNVVNEYLVSFSNTSTNGDSYFWEFGDGTTSTDRNAAHRYDDRGTYTVKLTVMNDCDTLTLEQDVDIVNYIGINESTLDEVVRLYPNPANGYVQLAVDGNLGTSTIQLALFNLTGQLITERSIKGAKGSVETMDVSDLERGVYLVQIKTVNEITTKRLVIQ